ncbi:hypothetical protein ACWGEU_22630 [Streptomyces goshikiensis]
MVLTPPFEPMLAQAAGYVPGSGVLASGFVAEQKFDGHRAILFTPTGPGGWLLLQTRRGSLVQDRFPDLVAAAEQLPDGLVLDGELVGGGPPYLNVIVTVRVAEANVTDFSPLPIAWSIFLMCDQEKPSRRYRARCFGVMCLMSSLLAVVIPAPVHFAGPPVIFGIPLPPSRLTGRKFRSLTDPLTPPSDHFLAYEQRLVVRSFDVLADPDWAVGL